MATLYIIRGLPGSGKSTIAKSMGIPHFEADMYFERLGRFDAAKLPEAHAWCLAESIMSITSGVDCVVSNTFTRHWEMAPYIKAASDIGARVEITTATGNFQNIHGVPESTIQKMRDRWEK